MGKFKVTAVIVTYNRKDLLIECLEAVSKQSFPVHQIILIDNASTDGTDQALRDNGYFDKPEMDYHRMDTNTGGAGGFYEGMKIARDTDTDWIWIMDDDTIPSEKCLEELINGLQIIQRNDPEENISFLASSVYGEKGEYMNVPTISSRCAENGYMTWYSHLEHGIVEIDHATFVSVLINKEAIEKCGLPCKDFFIWGDDGEYTKRISHNFGKAYMIGKSVAIHKRKNAVSLKYNFETDPSRIAMRHYLFRNLAIVDRYYSKGHLRTYLHLTKEVLTYPLTIGNKLNRLRQQAKIKGYFEGITQYGQFKSFIDDQLKNKGYNSHES